MKWAAIGLVIVACMMLLASAAVSPVAAATPTPYTPAPYATATSPYSYIRITPTPFPENVTTLPTLAVNDNAGAMADTAINTYRFFNRSHLIDTITFLLIVSMMGVMLVRWIKRTADSD